MISKRDVLVIACKVLGLLCLIWGIVGINFALPAIASWLKPRTYDYTSSWYFGAFLAMPVIFFLAAFILLKWSKALASLLIPEDQAVKIAIGEDWERPLYRLCLRVVGTVVLIIGTPKLIVAFSLLLGRPRTAPPDLGSTWGSFLAAVVYLALGIYLISGAPLIVNIAFRRTFREPDSDKIKATTSEPPEPSSNSSPK